jgi:hypothetical protein
LDGSGADVWGWTRCSKKTTHAHAEKGKSAFFFCCYSVGFFSVAGVGFKVSAGVEMVGGGGETGSAAADWGLTMRGRKWEGGREGGRERDRTVHRAPANARARERTEAERQRAQGKNGGVGRQFPAEEGAKMCCCCRRGGCVSAVLL